MANIKTPHADDAVFYEVWEIFVVDGRDREHRNTDLTFGDEAAAQAGIDREKG